MELFLRFTIDPDADQKYKKSLWFVSEEWEVEEAIANGKAPVWVESVGMYGIPHAGLSGHALSASSVEEAIEEIMAGQWFADPAQESWAIFEGTRDGVEQDTPEGDTFRPLRTLHIEAR